MKRPEKTDLERVRQVCYAMLEMPIEKTEFYPVVAHHPYTTSGLTFLYQDKNPVPVNLENPDDLLRWRNWVRTGIDKMKNVQSLYLMISAPYRTGFLSLVEQYLDKKDLASILREVWQGTDSVNDGTNISQERFVELFQECDLSDLMEPSELRTVLNMPATITIYRGVTSGKESSARSMSWTLNLKTARRFAFHPMRNKAPKTTGEVFQATIDRNDILAYFEGEEEIVVDPANLRGLQVVPLKGTQRRAPKL